MMRLGTYWPLALLLLLVPWSLFVWRTYQGTRWRLGLTWGLTVLSVLCLVLALCQLTWQRTSRSLSLVILLDSSASISQAQQAQAFQKISEVHQALSPRDRLAVLAFGKRPSLLVDWRSPQEFHADRLPIVPSDLATDLESAFRAALTLLGEAPGRLLLLSDGLANRGEVEQILPLLRASKVAVDVWPLERPETPEVVLTHVRYPRQVPEGRRIPLKVSIHATQPGRATLRVEERGMLRAERSLSLRTGLQLVSLELPPPTPGSHRYRVTLIASEDTVPGNNVGIALVTVSGKPQLLYVSNNAGTPLGAILKDAAWRRPADLPDVPGEYARYDATVIEDAPASAFRHATLEALATAVRVGGMGLWVLGATALGPEGIRGTPLADTLPVDLTPPEERKPKSVVFVVDRSGSMGVRAGAELKMDLARAAVAAGIRALKPEDRVGVIAFDALPHALVALQPVGDAERLLSQLNQLQAGHGTRMQPALEMAGEWLSQSPPGQRALVLLSDGKIGEGDDPVRVVEALARRRIQTSSISLGSSPLMQQIAQAGGGRYHEVRDLFSLPHVVLQEVKRQRDWYEDGRFEPRADPTAAILAGIRSWPPLYGYIRARLRSGAEAPLTVAEGKPLLAIWRFGQGWVASFLSDFNSAWGRAWVRWPLLQRFVQQVLDGLLSRDGEEGLEITLEGTQVILEVNELNETQGEMVRPSGETRRFSFRNEGGRWLAALPVEAPGDYLIRSDTGHVLLPVAYAPEWRELGVNEPLLRHIAERTGGRFRPTAAEVARRPPQPQHDVRELWRELLWAALIFFLMGLAARRLSLRLPFQIRSWEPERPPHRLSQLRIRRPVPAPLTQVSVRFASPRGQGGSHPSAEGPLVSQLLRARRHPASGRSS